MDTKWKNIKSKAKSFLEKCWLSSTGIAVKLFCFVLAGFGIAFWYSVVVYRTYHPTGESLFSPAPDVPSKVLKFYTP